jgi:hypothetical protein
LPTPPDRDKALCRPGSASLSHSVRQRSSVECRSALVLRSHAGLGTVFMQFVPGLAEVGEVNDPPPRLRKIYRHRARAAWTSWWGAPLAHRRQAVGLNPRLKWRVAWQLEARMPWVCEFRAWMPPPFEKSVPYFRRTRKVGMKAPLNVANADTIRSLSLGAMEEGVGQLHIRNALNSSFVRVLGWCCAEALSADHGRFPM